MVFIFIWFRYNRYEKNREMGNRESTITNGQVDGAKGGQSLIDLNEEEAALPQINSQLSALCEYMLFEGENGFLMIKN